MNQMIQPMTVEEQLFYPAPVNPHPFTESLIQFLQRADLKGAEVPTYAELWNVVQALQEGELVVVTAEQVEMAKDHARLWNAAHGRLADLEAIIEADPELKHKVFKALSKRSMEQEGQDDTPDPLTEE